MGLALAFTLAGATMTCAAETVTVSNLVRAETDQYFSSVVEASGGIGLFQHYRQPTPVENQQVIRMNRDTLYSAAVFDLSTPYDREA